MKFWVGIYENKHGSDTSLVWQDEEPTRSELMELFPEFEEGMDGEYLRFEGPFTTPRSPVAKTGRALVDVFMANREEWCNDEDLATAMEAFKITLDAEAAQSVVEELADTLCNVVVNSKWSFGSEEVVNAVVTDDSTVEIELTTKVVTIILHEEEKKVEDEAD